MKIYKYILEIKDEQTLELPLGSQFLSVQNQGDKICVWMAVSDGVPTYIRFYIVGTGHDAPPPDEVGFLGTVQINSYVWHVFWRG